MSNVLKQKWYLLEQPWVDSKQAGLIILANNPDPHLGELVCFIAEPSDNKVLTQQQRYAIAQHIVEIHNSWLLGNE